MLPTIISTPTTVEAHGQSSAVLESRGLLTSLEHDLLLRWKDCAVELVNMRSLGDDWDGEGAEAPSGALIDSALDLSFRLVDLGISPPDRLSAAPDGSVILEWQLPELYFEIEVVDPDRVEVMSIRQGAAAEHKVWMRQERNEETVSLQNRSFPDPAWRQTTHAPLR